MLWKKGAAYQKRSLLKNRKQRPLLAPPGFWAKNNKEMAVQLYCTAIFVLYFWIRGQFLQETQVYLGKLPINKENGLFSHQNNEFFIIYLFCIWGLYDIITAGQLLYFDGRGNMFALLTAPWPIIPFHTLCSWYNNRRAVIIFQCPKCSPQLAEPVAATALDGQLYHCARCALWYNNRRAVIIFQVAGQSCSRFIYKLAARSFQRAK